MTSHQEQCLRIRLRDIGDPEAVELERMLDAALDAAAREALREAARNCPAPDSIANWGNVAFWLRQRADALSGRHEEETKTKS